MELGAERAWLIAGTPGLCSVGGVLQPRARHLLGTIGAKVPRKSGAVPPGLARLGITAREAEVLQLLDAGLSNADIATRLFLSVRTVETHVSSLLRKCGVASREELPGIVHRM